ncbi:MAG: glycosyltransferase [Ignavibacteria bacterium]|nr:glycosyltransferase [Ignavibacteria bacterium]
MKLCFVGTLTENKGSSLIIDALRDFNDKQSIDEIVFAGGGPLIEEHKKSSVDTGVKMSFPGFVGRQGLEKIYSDSHIIILPSKSEGFPKVIAEAAAYGCVPIVSDVSSVSQYFGEKSAFLLKDISAAGLKTKLSEAIKDREKLKHMSANCTDSAGQFTFSHYMKLLKIKILDV